MTIRTRTADILNRLILAATAGDRYADPDAIGDRAPGDPAADQLIADTDRALKRLGLTSDERYAAAAFSVTTTLHAPSPTTLHGHTYADGSPITPVPDARYLSVWDEAEDTFAYHAGVEADRTNEFEDTVLNTAASYLRADTTHGARRAALVLAGYTGTPRADALTVRGPFVPYAARA